MCRLFLTPPGVLDGSCIRLQHSSSTVPGKRCSCITALHLCSTCKAGTHGVLQHHLANASLASSHTLAPAQMSVSPSAFVSASLSVLQAYDQHLNMILGDVEETITTVEVDDETYEEIIKVSSRLGMPQWVFADREAKVETPRSQLCADWDRATCVCSSVACCAGMVATLLHQPKRASMCRSAPWCKAWKPNLTVKCVLLCGAALQTQKRSIPYLFVRGDGVILISPPLRS